MMLMKRLSLSGEHLRFGFKEIGTIEDFLEKAQKAGHKIRVAEMWFYDTAEYDLDECILVIRPENIRYQK